jgi:hypothetical protein
MQRPFALTALLALVVAQSAIAQAPPPPRLEPIPEPPPQSIGIDNDAAPDRGIRLTPGADERVEETVIDGKRAIRVINPNGTEYYLIEDLGDGTQTGQNSQDSRVRVPRWVIRRF